MTAVGASAQQAQPYPVRQFSAAEDPAAAEACCMTVSQAMGQDGNNDLWSADPKYGTARWYAIPANALKRNPAVRMLHSIGDDHSAVAFAHLYPEEAVPDGAPEPPDAIDLTQYGRPEAAALRDDLMDFLAQGKKDFLKAHGPFLYIMFLSTWPARQGQGLGSALLRLLTDRADSLGRWCYIEASSPDNRRLYLRHGFQDIEHKEWSLPELPGKKAELFAMGRSPAGTAGGAAAAAQAPAHTSTEPSD